MYANTKDHLLSRLCVDRASRRMVPTVPACSRCNAILRDIAIVSIHERAAFIEAVERKKQHRLLKRPNWTDQEIAQLGRHLQDYVIRREVAKEILLIRLRNLRSGGIESPNFTVLEIGW